MSTKSSTTKNSTFPENDIIYLEGALRKVDALIEISWEFKYDRLEVNGLLKDDELLTFTHSKSAMAFLDGFLEGYDVGYGDGRGN